MRDQILRNLGLRTCIDPPLLRLAAWLLKYPMTTKHACSSNRDQCLSGAYISRSVEHINQALKKGRHFKNIIDMHTWPYQEVVRFLKGHSPSFSLHDMKEEKILLTGIPQKILFDADTEPESIPAQHEP